MTTLTNKKIPLGSTSLTLNSVRRMWRELNAVVAEQGEVELARLVRSADQSVEDFEEYKNSARRDIFKILGTVEFDNDDAIHDVDPDIVNVEDDGPRIRFIVNRLGMLTPYRRPILTPCRRSALGLPGAGRGCRG